MQKNLATPKPPESPFFGLLAGADEVQIREVHLDDREQLLSSLEKTARDVEHEKAHKNCRSFFVHIKNDRPRGISEALEADTYDHAQLQQSAELLLENSDYVLARNIFSFLLKENVKDVRSMRGLGLCLLRLGEIASAKKCFRALTDHKPSDEAYLWLGQCYGAEENDLAAADCFQKVENISSLESRFRFELHKSWGNCLTRLGRLKEAGSCYARALELDPNSDVLQINIGTLNLQDKNYASARHCFQKAIALNSFNAKGHCGLGLVCLAEEDADQAKAYFHQALDLDSQNVVALHQLLALVQNDEDHGEIKPRLLAFLQREPNSAEVQCAVAALLFKEGAFKECETHVDACLAVDPNHARARKIKSELGTATR